MIPDEELKRDYREGREALDEIPPTFDAVQRRNVEPVSVRGPLLGIGTAIAAIVALLIFWPFGAEIEQPSLPKHAEVSLPETVDESLEFAEWEAPTDFLLEHDALDIAEPPAFDDAFEDLELIKEL